MKNNHGNKNYDKLISSLCTSIKASPLGSVLFVVGAGASVDAGVKTSPELIKEMRIGYDDLINQMLRQRGISNYDDVPFEMIMSLYNEIHDEEAGFQFLKSRMPNVEEACTKNIPFAYEVIAHMFYFRISRYIISLNFDELLERALNDEVGKNDYRRIHSRSIFERLIVTEEYNKESFHRFLFKPHGTIGYRRTLRHTWDDVINLDKEKKEVLSEVVQKSPIIISIGYGFNDRDIRPLILSALANNDDNNIENNLWIITKGELGESIKEISRIKGVHVIDCGAEEFFRKLSMCLFIGQYEDCYPGIHKHLARYLINNEIIERKKAYPGMIEEIDYLIEKIKDKNILNYIFEKMENKMEIIEECLIKIKYLHMRILVEILIFIVSIKGKFKRTVLLESARINRYLRELQRLISKLYPNEIQGYIYEKYTISTALSSFNNIFIKGISNKSEIYDEMIICKGSEERNMQYEEYLTEGLLECLRVRKNGDNYNNIKKCLIEITRKIDISLTDETTRIIQFNRPWIICNFRNLAGNTRDILVKSKNLKIIAETGEWIERIFSNETNFNEYAFKTMEILISDYTKEEESFHRERALKVYNYINYELRKKIEEYGKRLDIKRYIGDMPHHMTIGDGRAIYFYRYGRSITVCPILLGKEEDLSILNSYFKSKWNIKKRT